MIDQRHLLTVAEAAKLLRMIPGRVTRLANKGEIPHVRLPGGDIVFDPKDLWTWIDARKCKERAAR